MLFSSQLILRLSEDLKAEMEQLQAQIVEAIATLEIYFTNAVAIGEHPDLLAEVDKYLDMLEDAQGKINALDKHFTSQPKSEKELLQEEQGYSVHNGAEENFDSEPE